MVDKDFPCYKCGACCHYLHTIPGYEHYRHPEKSHCRHLRPDNSCAIYLLRPEICSVRKMYLHKYAKIMTWDRYCEITLKICGKLEEEVKKKGQE